MKTRIDSSHPTDTRSLSYIRTTRWGLYQDFIGNNFAVAVHSVLVVPQWHRVLAINNVKWRFLVKIFGRGLISKNFSQHPPNLNFSHCELCNVALHIIQLYIQVRMNQCWHQMNRDIMIPFVICQALGAEIFAIN